MSIHNTSRARHGWMICCMAAACLASCVGAWAKEPILPADAGIPVVAWKDAPRHMDEEVIVQGRIVQGNNIGNICFLNFDRARTFTAVIHERNFKKFPEKPEVFYPGKIVRIRGVVSAYRGNPQIEISNPDQVTILEEEPPIPSAAAAEKKKFDGTVTIGTFNVLNLFDEYDAPYHSDEGTDPKPRTELEALARTIRKVDADVLALQEVECRGYLERFIAAMLPDMGYEHVVLFEGNDRRGIDVALVSRLPVGPVTSHRHLQFSDGSSGMMKFNRDLLKVRIEPEGYRPFDVFVVHFKSKRGGPVETERFRVAECRATRDIATAMIEKDQDALFLICGDFNDTWDSRPLKTLRGEGPTALRGFVSDLPPNTGSYNRMKANNLIDYIIASPAMAELYVEKSYSVLVGTVESGGSDHNPVTAKFRIPPLK